MKNLIIRAGALGDTLMLMPSIKAMRCEYETIILGRSPGIEYIEPMVDLCIDIERGGWYRLYNPGAVIDMPSFRPDRVIGFINDPVNIIYDNLSSLFKDSKISIFPPFPEPGLTTHVSLYMANAIQSTGININPHAAYNEAFQTPLIASAGGIGKRIVLHPGSGSKKKNYSPEFWLELIKGLREQAQYKTLDITILIGPAEQDIFKAFDSNLDVYVSHDRESLLSILDNACLYIGHDSGVTHLAAMMGINTIALFRGTSIQNWRPLGPNVKIVEEKGDLKSILGETKALAFDVIRQMAGM